MRFRLSQIAQLCLMAILIPCSASLFAQNTLDLAGLTSTSPAHVAFSMRKLSSGYNGPALKVRRGGSNDLQDINFTAGGELDLAALTTFIGSSDAFVHTWYDQSGNGRNLVQGTNSKQPWIAHGGVVDTENGKPFIRFYGHNGIDTDPDRLNLSEVSTTGHALIVNKFVRGQVGSLWGDGFLLGHSSVYNWHSENMQGLLFASYGSSSIAGARVWQNGRQISALAAIFNATLMINSVEPLNPSTGTAWDNLGSDRNGTHDTNLGGGYAEVITFTSSLSNTNRFTAELNQGAFYGIPVGDVKLSRYGSLILQTPDMVSSLGRVGQAALTRNGQRSSVTLPGVPLSSDLSLNGSTASVKLTLTNYDGGSTIAGLCWSTVPNPTINDRSTISNVSSSIVTVYATGLVDGTTYYVRPYVMNDLGTTYGTEISFTHLSVGQNYKGGKIAYIYQPADAQYTALQVHGLIAGPTDFTGRSFGCNTTNIPGARAAGFGSGMGNTDDIAAACAASAAADCMSYSTGGNSDWYLPSIDELSAFYRNRALIGGFVANQRYWSSTQGASPATQVKVVIFNINGSISDYSKGIGLPFRPVSYF